ncbi:hypothetical protein ASPNIDRAFT_135959, partial [Aspergillus niger ATCC 1015]
SQFTSTAVILMFNQVRADTVITCLHGNQPFPEDLLALQGEAAKHADAYSPFWLLGVLVTNRFDVYQSTWAIRVWNNARSIQMIVSEILYSILMKVLATDLPATMRMTLEAKFQETIQIMTSLGEDMLATVPQMLGYVSLVGGQHISYNSTSTASVPGGYSLIWTLYMVGKSPVTKRKSRKWVIRRLQEIS